MYINSNKSLIFVLSVILIALIIAWQTLIQAADPTVYTATWTTESHFENNGADNSNYRTFLIFRRRIKPIYTRI
jgi:hypothetical protein